MYCALIALRLCCAYAEPDINSGRLFLTLLLLLLLPVFWLAIFSARLPTVASITTLDLKEEQTRSKCTNKQCINMHVSFFYLHAELNTVPLSASMNMLNRFSSSRFLHPFFYSASVYVPLTIWIMFCFFVGCCDCNVKQAKAMIGDNNNNNNDDDGRQRHRALN